MSSASLAERTPSARAVEMWASARNFEFRRATTPQDRALVFALRDEVVLSRGWGSLPDRDEWDESAVHLIGFFDGVAQCAGRLVFPPNSLPTEAAANMTVEPQGRVVDVSRMVARPGTAGLRSGGFAALLAAIFTVMREAEFTLACGMMSESVRRVIKMLGLTVNPIGPDQQYCGEVRAPVLFDAASAPRPLLELLTMSSHGPQS